MNDLTLGDSHPATEELKPIKVGGKSTAIETAQHGNGARINGDLLVTGTAPSDDTKLPLAGGTMTGGLVMDTGQSITTSLISTVNNVGIYDGSNLGIVLDPNDNARITLYSVAGVATDYLTINTAANGASYIQTVDDGGDSDGHLTIAPDGNTVIAGNNVNVDTAGDISLDAGGGDVTILQADLTIPVDKKVIFGNTGEYIAGDDTDLDIVSSNDATINAGSTIILDSADGTFEMHGAGTTAKFADMYAGMILGYTRIQNDGTGAANNAIVVNTSSMTVLQTNQGTDCSIQFIVPPSGNVEIQCSFWMQGNTDGAKFSLSTGTSYAELGITHTYDADYTVFLDETDHNFNTVSFSVTGLTAGTDTTYYVAALASGAGIVINHGRFRTTGNHYPPIILKAIALPATIVTGE